MKFLTRAKNWLKVFLLKKVLISNYKQKQKILEKIADNPDAISVDTEERIGCEHKKLEMLCDATYQCQNKECGLVIEILNDRSFYPKMFVAYSEKIKQNMKMRKNDKV